MSSNENKLQSLRKRAGFSTAKSFAEELGVPTSTYARYEQSPDSMPLKAAWKIANILDCTIDDVVGRKEGSSTKEESRTSKRINALTEKYRQSIMDYLEFLEEKSEEEKERDYKDIEKKIFYILHKYEKELNDLSITDEYFNKKLRTLGEDNYRETLEEYVSLQLDSMIAQRADSISEQFVEHYRNQDSIKMADEDGNVVAVYDPKKKATEEELKEMKKGMFKRLSKELSEDSHAYIDLIMAAYDQERKERHSAKKFIFFKDE